MLDKKVAVVYGGGGVIGGAIARTFAREGAHVYLAGRTPTALDRVVQSIGRNGGQAEAALADAADEHDVRRHLEQVIDRTGHIDILVNAVGIPHVQGPPLADLDVDQFMAPVVGYLRTLFVTARAAAPHLAAQRSGVVLTLSTPAARLTGSGSWVTASPQPRSKPSPASWRVSSALTECAWSASGQTPSPRR